TATKCPVLINHGVNAAGFWIHHHDCAGVMAKRLNGGFAHFQIFSSGVVLGDIRLGFIAHAFVDGSLASDRRLARSFGATASFFQITAMRALEFANLGCEFPLAQLAARTPLELGNVGRLFSGKPRLLSASLSFRQVGATAAASARAGQLATLTTRESSAARYSFGSGFSTSRRASTLMLGTCVSL